MRRTELVVLILILSIAVGMRIGGLHTTPPGLYPDEAVDGNNALAALDSGDYKVFYPNNNGEEGLYANIVAFSIRLFGNTAFALRLVSAIAGILTVLGTYLLARRMFDDWEFAAMAAFLMAVGFWHVNFSRIGFRAILSPLMAVWSFYYLYAALESHRLWHWALSGLFLGLGMYTYIAFRVMPLAILLTFLGFWLAVQSHFGADKHLYTRRQLLGGLALLIGVSIVVSLPLAMHFAVNPADFTGRAGQVSVFSDSHPALLIIKNIVLTVGMFFFEGDHNWRHNYAGAPILFWPVATLFAVGLMRTMWRFSHSWKLRGHPGLPQTLLLSWFFVGLLPEILSNESVPHALRALTVAPPTYIMAATGLHWFYVWLRRSYAERSPHGAHDGRLVIGFTVIAFLAAIGFADASRYFHDWGQHPYVAASFNTSSAIIAQQINSLPTATLKYVATQPEGVTIDGIGVAAQTVMYLTDTATPAKQKAKNVRYLTPEQYRAHRYPAGAVLFRL